MRAYLAVEGRESELLEELSHSGAEVVERVERLVLTNGGPKRAAWATNVWYETERIPIVSVREAQAALRTRGARWCLLSQLHHRRAALIQSGVSGPTAGPLHFGERPPREALGSWTLLDEHTVLASPRCSSAFPNGEVEFVEDRHAPPSRAYLKLWELFTVTLRQPRKGELCLDLGSSPGGWTWVLASLGARVKSVDKAPLEARVAGMTGVRFVQQSAFAIEPETHPAVDWLFSDVICYPSRLLEYIERWIHAGKAKNIVCTLKFQGDTDHETARRFASIPGSRLMHLHHNRHELTWCRFGEVKASV
ncbi:MAG TPA: SAM-dependent methyltransferase [Polyangiaceae bacterium]